MQRVGLEAETNMHAAIAEVSINDDVNCLVHKLAEIEENRLKVQAMLEKNERSFTLHTHMNAYIQAQEAVRICLLMCFLPTDATA